MPAPNRASSPPSRRRASAPADGRLTVVRPRPTASPSSTPRGRGRGPAEFARRDFSSRLAAALPALRTPSAAYELLTAVMSALTATAQPTGMARGMLEPVARWLPAPCLVLISADDTGQLSVLADRGLRADVASTVLALAGWFFKTGPGRSVPFLAADLSRDSRVRADLAATVVALPLIAHRRRVGVLIALDPRPSPRLPLLPRSVCRTLRSVTDLTAVAIHSALQLGRALELSVTDDLTRLYNSRYLNQALRHEAKRASRGGRPLSLLFIDLDGFKSVNDTHGHLCGSRTLVEAAGVIRSSARETDIVARFGGDEFALVLPDTGADGAHAVGERIRARIAAQRFLAAEGLHIRLTASVGLATLPDAAASAEELIHAADSAMYRVKRFGKNGIRAAASGR